MSTHLGEEIIRNFLIETSEILDEQPGAFLPSIERLASVAITGEGRIALIPDVPGAAGVYARR